VKDFLSHHPHNAFLEGLISGNRQFCSRYAHKYMEQTQSIQDLYENIFKASLYEIGKLWEYNRISVATEHLASAIVEVILNEFYSEIATEKKKQKSVILSCIENEQHQIGIKMISDVFEMQGWSTYFLGANTPARELVDYTKLIKPDLVAISMSLYFHMPNLVSTLRRMREELSQTPILVGGQAFRHVGVETLEEFSPIHFHPNLKSTEAFIKNLAKNG
jgi:methanogenic corrinoid protein MtbC1